MAALGEVRTIRKEDLPRLATRSHHRAHIRQFRWSLGREVSDREHDLARCDDATIRQFDLATRLGLDDVDRISIDDMQPVRGMRDRIGKHLREIVPV